MNFKWPQKPDNVLSPWYVIVWRSPWFVLLYLLLALCMVTLTAGFGIKRAIEFWNDVT